MNNLIFNNAGVLSIGSVEVVNVFGNAGSDSNTETASNALRSYSSVQYDISANTDRGIIFGPIGSIFEVRYPQFDIVGASI